MRQTLASLVDDWRRLGTEIAIVAHRGNRAFRTSYGDLAELAGRFAAELDRRGIGAGDRVLIWGENNAAWVAALFGCVLRGVIAVPLDAAGSAAFAARVVEETQPRLAVGDAPLLRQLGAELACLALDDLWTALPTEPSFQVNPEVREDTPFQIVFTSGTTSEPKGVVHTHRNVLASLRPIEAEMGKYKRYERWVHPLRFLHTLPLSHVFGQFMGLWIPALLGAEIHFSANAEPVQMLHRIRRERISVLVAVPRILELLRAHLRSRFPSLQAQLDASAGFPAWKRWWRFRQVHNAFGLKFWAFICGGATLPDDLEMYWNGLGFALIQGYGMTETAALVTLNHPFKVGRGTLGKALPGRELRLSEDGEILVRGDVLAAGAWQDGRFQPREEEWLATGDLATQDAGGELRFSGRRGDVIVTGAGMNVHPRDLEAVLSRQPGVRGCVVVGCDLANGAEPVGVVLFAGEEDALRDAMARANTELQSYQQMRRILRWPDPAFPHTSTGKLLRRQVAAWACAQLVDSSARDGKSTSGDALLALLEGITHESVGGAGESSRLTEDLHLDSLGRVLLQSALEQRFGVEVKDDDVHQVQTLGELRALISAEGPAVHQIASHQVQRVAADAASTGARPKLPYVRWPWSAPIRWLRAAFWEAVAVPLVYVLAKPRVVHDQPIQNRPMLLIANHVNTYDVPLVLFALPAALRHSVATAMSAEVLSDLRYGTGQGTWLLRVLARPAYWLLLALFNVFPLPRSSGFRESFAHAGEALDRGQSVLVFPEGRRGWTGELQPFRPGIGLLAQASRVPVLPIAIQGAGNLSRKGRGWFRIPGLIIHVGRPVTLLPTVSPEEITAQLEAALRALGPS